MAALAILIVSLCCLVAPATSNLHIKNCKTDEIDLLLLVNWYKQTEIVASLEQTFVKLLIEVFLNPKEETLDRLHVSLATYGKGNTFFIFEDFTNRKDLDYAVTDAYSKIGRDEAGILMEHDQPDSKKVYKIAQRAFRPSQGARSKATRVAVIVMSTSIKIDIKMREDLQSLHDMGVIVFLIMVDKFTKNSNTDFHFEKGHVLHVENFLALTEDQNIPLTLCADCYSTWFRFPPKEDSGSNSSGSASGRASGQVSGKAPSKASDKVSGPASGKASDKASGTASSRASSTSPVSCYALKSNGKDVIHWKDAMELCLELNSNLLAIETVEELRYLETRLHWEIQTSLRHLHSDYYNNFQNMHIGLERDMNTLTKRFRWTNGRPLTVTHWDQNSPNGGYVEACGIWKFDNIPLNTTLYHSRVWNFENERAVLEKFIKTEPTGWADVGCGEKITPVYVCETPRRHNDSEVGAMTVKAASEDRMKAALRRGEFRLDADGALISLPQFQQDIRDLKRAFKDYMFENLFDCESIDNRYIAFIYVCDHVRHCRNGYDENNCLYPRCKEDEFLCDSGQCVPKIAKCDVYADCYDGSDETDCIYCKGRRCCDGSCLPAHWFFDGEVDCSGCSSPDIFTDENAGFTSVPNTCPFVCNRSECVSVASLGDRHVDCTGPEGPLDETLGLLETGGTCVNMYNRKLWAPKCVYTKDRYGSVLGCRDMSHLQDCDKFRCPEGYSKCPGTYCIPTHMLNDKILDCPFGEDERTYYSICEGNFRCYSKQIKDTICLHPDLVCDGHAHCPNGDDEDSCHPTCMHGFLCQGGAVSPRQTQRISFADLSGIDPRTRYLNLSGNDLSAAFPPKLTGRLVNVFEFHCSDCNITSVESVEKMASAQLITVFSMDLSCNNIVEIRNTSIFPYMRNLRNLNLSHNLQLQTLDNNCFETYHASKTKLTSLDLSYTAITSLRALMFKTLNKLVYLNLRGTQISRLHARSLPSRMTLDFLDLRDTPLKYIQSGAFTGVRIRGDLYTDKFSLCCPQVRGTGIPGHKCRAPEATISSCSDLIGQGIQRVLIFLVGLSALIGNVVVLVYRLMWGREILKKAYGVFVTQLAVSDLFMGVYLLLIGVADTTYRGQYAWKEDEWRSSLSCKIAGFLSSVSSETSIVFVFLITLDRYLVIKYPFGNVKFSKVTTFLGCLGAWLFGVSVAVIPLMPAYAHWNIYSSSGMCVALPVSKEKSPGWGYSALVFVAFNFVLFLIIALGQLGIYRSLSLNKAPKCRIQQVQDILVARQLAMVVLSDFLCWFPVGIIGIMAMTDHAIGVTIYSWLAILVLPINSALNPLLYTFPILMDKWERFKQGHNMVHSIQEVHMSTDRSTSKREKISSDFAYF